MTRRGRRWWSKARRRWMPGWIYIPSATAAWVPTDLADLYAWYDASDASTITASSGLVSQWNDKSGGGYNLTSSGVSRPSLITSAQNGKDVLRSSGSNNMKAATASNWKFLHHDPSTVAMVIKNGTSSDPNLLNGIMGTNDTSVWNVGFDLLYDDRASVPLNDCVRYRNCSGAGTNGDVFDVQHQNVLTGNAYLILVLWADPANSTAADRAAAYVNGGSALQGNTQNTSRSTSDPAHALQIMATGNGTRGFTGDFAEVVIADAKIGTSDREKLEGYLAHKWGLTADLPSGHPYKNSAP